MACIIKPDQQTQGWVAQRAIGAGFQGVNFVDCRSAAEAAECVRLVRPETPTDGGVNSAAPRRFALMGEAGSTAYVQALRDVMVIIMIEKKAAVEHLEEILAVPGIDMVQWGPSDYSMSIGRAGERNHPEVKAAEKKVFETALRMGIPPRAEIGSPDDARRFQDMGVRHFSLGTDINILHDFLKKNGEELRKVVKG
jgi:4-hydroxy-2-oxoheptanedioate aldolase